MTGVLYPACSFPFFLVSGQGAIDGIHGSIDIRER